MILTKEEFDALSPLYECIVEIEALKSNVVKFADGTEIEVVTDSISVDPDGYKKKLLLTLGRRLADMPRESEEKKSLRAEYKKIKAEVESAKSSTDQENGNRQAIRCGKLAKKPKINALRDGNIFSCELDCEVGETVYWDGFWAAQMLDKNTKGDDYMIDVEGKKYLRIPAISLFAVRNGDEYRGLNGFLICEQLKEKERITISGLYVPVEEKPTTRARVVATSKYLPVYRNKELFKNNDIKVGDVVHSEDHFQIELDKTASSTTKLIRILNSSVLYVEN